MFGSHPLLVSLDLLGIFVFALSGGLVAVRKDLDIFGVIFLAGTTGLGDGSRVAKNSARVEALGAVDELNSCLGVLMFGAAGSLIPSAGGYRWLGWIALPLGIALLIPFADFFALLLTAIWLIVASIMFYRSAPRPAGTPQPAS